MLHDDVSVDGFLPHTKLCMELYKQIKLFPKPEGTFSVMTLVIHPLCQYKRSSSTGQPVCKMVIFFTYKGAYVNWTVWNTE